MRLIIKRGLLFAVLLSVLVASGWLRPLHISAVQPLEFARDYVGTLTPNYPQVTHDISFTLPASSSQIRPEDWIEVALPNYWNITIPNGIRGSFGEPTYTLTGNIIKISNIAILSGSNVDVLGITATNPVEGVSNHIILRVVEDNKGERIVRNESIVIPSDSKNSISATAIIESSLCAVDISGYTLPDSFVILTENTVALGTVTSDGTGFFRFTLNAMDPGDHLFTITSSDNLKRTTSAHTVSLFMLPATAYSVSGILLSPTIGIDKEKINPGDIVTIQGQAKPLSSISIVMQPVVRTYTVTTDAEGNWSYTIDSADTSTLIPGVYQLRAQAEADGILSLFSPTVNLTVQAPDTDNPLPCSYVADPLNEGQGTIFPGETNERAISLADLNTMTSHGDLNCDGKTNLRDFSILLTHWNTNHRRADIIVDGIVNLKDFSRMMFYFQR